MFQAAVELGLEGVVGKKSDSRYRAGRSENWIKLRRELTDDFVIMGDKQRGSDIRSLMIGQYIDGKLIYSGSVGSGLGQNMRTSLLTSFDKIRTIKPPKNTPKSTPESSDIIWKSAKLVCEVKYTEFTPVVQLRHPVLLRLRDDKKAKQCTRETLNQELEEVDVIPTLTERSVHLSNLDKIFWPDDAFTKGDMLRYYEAISP